METTKACLRNTKLIDRTLWFDGKSSFDPNNLLTSVRRYDVQFVNGINELVVEYNKHVAKEQELKVKTACDPLSYDWNIPPNYKMLDVVGYIFDKHDAMSGDFPTEEFHQREIRLSTELLKYEEHGFIDVLRTIIWIINTLTVNNVIWGVGRGSSVSSYALYVIGVHDVDSYKYELDISDFLHE